MSSGRRTRVLLLFGGRSAEHDVSRATAVAVAAALDPARYEIVPVAITTNGQWLHATDAQRAIAAGPAALPSHFAAVGDPVGIGELATHAAPESAEVAEATSASPLAGIDVVLPLLHGPYGEDGTIQGLFELAGLAYVGSGVLGSAVGMDKVMAKRAFGACGLATPDWRAHRDGDDAEVFADRVESELGLPCFVKPANMGSSVGVTKAHDRAELTEAIDVALGFDEWILAEEAIIGREIEVAVLGHQPPVASVPGEIIPGGEFYDYTDKYEDGVAQLLVPAPLDPADADAARALALAAFDACRLEAMARVDLFLEPDGRGFLVNEVNTMPGFTPISMFPRLWEASGKSYAQLLDELVDLAFARRARRAARAGRQRA